MGGWGGVGWGGVGMCLALDGHPVVRERLRMRLAVAGRSAHVRARQREGLISVKAGSADRQCERVACNGRRPGEHVMERAVRRSEGA
jgi:hypothetical protein